MFLALAVSAPLSAPASNAQVSRGAFEYQSSSPLAPTVSALEPSPGARLRTFFPRLSATIYTHGRAQLKLHSVHLYVDGADVTQLASITRDQVTYLPRQHVTQGWHDAFLQGVDTANHSFSDAWVFQTQDPDVDMPFDGNDGSALLPIGVGFGGPFSHFFIVSPFNGFAQLQLCGLQVPFIQAGATPVFFATVPVAFGSNFFLGCTPGVVFTPFGFGTVSPIFFPLEIAGPSIFQNGHPVSRMVQSSMMPVYGRTALPVHRVTSMPGYSALPAYRLTRPILPAMPGSMPTMALPTSHLPGIVVYPGTARPLTVPAHSAGLPAHPVMPVHPVLPVHP